MNTRTKLTAIEAYWHEKGNFQYKNSKKQDEQQQSKYQAEPAMPDGQSSPALTELSYCPAEWDARSDRAFRGLSGGLAHTAMIYICRL